MQTLFILFNAFLNLQLLAISFIARLVQYRHVEAEMHCQFGHVGAVLKQKSERLLRAAGAQHRYGGLTQTPLLS